MSQGVLTIVTPSLALHLIHVHWMTSLGATRFGSPGDDYTYQHGGSLALAFHESVRDNIVFPLPDAQVVPRDLMKG